MKLKPGGFYEARNGSIWCCYRLKPDAQEHARADCINIETSQTEYFYENGGYIRAHTPNGQDLIEEVMPEHAILRGRG